MCTASFRNFLGAKVGPNSVPGVSGAFFHAPLFQGRSRVFQQVSGGFMSAAGDPGSFRKSHNCSMVFHQSQGCSRGVSWHSMGFHGVPAFSKELQEYTRGLQWFSVVLQSISGVLFH